MVICDHSINQVLLAPIKAYSAGLCMSSRIVPEYIAYLVRPWPPRTAIDALQLSSMDSDSFNHIEESELLGKQWQKSDPSKSPNIRVITQRFNQFCAWAVSTVLLEKEERERANVIAKVAARCITTRITLHSSS